MSEDRFELFVVVCELESNFWEILLDVDLNDPLEDVFLFLATKLLAFK